MEYRGYTARVEFDPDAGILHGEVEGVRDVITFEGESVAELRRAFEESVDDYLEMCAEREEEPDKPYSGKFVIRIEPELHRDLAVAAARTGKSLNAFAAEAMKALLAQSAKSKNRVTSGPNASVGDVDPKSLFSRPGAAVVAEPGPFAPAWSRRSSTTPGVSQKTPGSQGPHSNTPSHRKVA